MSIRISYNERSWAIDLITEINLWTNQRNIFIKRAGGENTINTGGGVKFPDVLLFGDFNKGRILQGWELKMPDTPIDDETFIADAKKKAEFLSLNSFIVWNVSNAVLYKIEDSGVLTKVKSWNNLSHIKKREEVIEAKAEISKMLIEILQTVNDFIANGVIKTTSVVTVLSSESVYSLVQRNIGSYVIALKNKSQSDSQFNDEITLWWRYAKNDYPEESDRFTVLARNNLLFLLNKFLFAHVLKSYQKDAALVDNIKYDTDIKNALETFQQLSEKCDFWNIFSTQKGEEEITKEVWEDITSFNALLKEFSFDKIEKSLLHDLIGHTIYKNKRKYAGQFTTPIELANLLAKLIIKDKSALTIDPCCGTGTILKEVYKIKKQNIGTDQGFATLWGTDKFSLPLQMAMFNLADPEALGSLIKVFRRDATQLVTGQTIELREPFKGNIIKEELPKFKYIVSNLPFVQQEDLEFLNPNVSDINNLISEKIGDDYVLDGRSDLYAYLPFYFWNLLEENGKIAIIISNSWLGTAWGEIFFNTLSRFFNVENIITSGLGRWFNNAKVVTNIVSLAKKNPLEPEDSALKTKFIVTTKRITDYSNEETDELSAIISLKDYANESDIRLSSYTKREISEIRKYGLNLNSFFADARWVLEISDKLVKISDFFDIARGERRGWDKLFYPEQGNNIEKEYLKPVLKTPRSIQGLIANPDSLAFCCEKTKEELEELGHSGALAWINKFEGQTNERGIPLTESLSRPGVFWYTMLPKTMGEIVASINFGDRLFFARFEAPTFVNQRLVRFTRKNDNVDVELAHALMNSLLGLFFIEAMGTGRGEGVLDLSKDKIEKDLHIIDPNLITPSDREKIINHFKVLEARDILPLEKELQQKDRIAFDDVVLDSIGCGQYKDKIMEALLALYSIRASVNR